MDNVEKLEKEIASLRADNDKLKNELASTVSTTLQSEIDKLKLDAATSKTVIEAFKTEISSLKDEKATLLNDKTTLDKSLSELKSEVASLKTEQVKADRLVVMANAGIDAAKAAKLIVSLAHLDDVAFAEVIETIKPVEVATEEKVNDEEETETEIAKKAKAKKAADEKVTKDKEKDAKGKPPWMKDKANLEAALDDAEADEDPVIPLTSPDKLKTLAASVIDFLDAEVDDRSKPRKRKTK